MFYSPFEDFYINNVNSRLNNFFFDNFFSETKLYLYLKDLLSDIVNFLNFTISNGELIKLYTFFGGFFIIFICIFICFYIFDINSYFIKIFLLFYRFIYDLVESNLGKDYVNLYFPFFFYLFLFISAFNISGLIPYSFAFNGHIIITFTLSLFVWSYIVFIGIIKYGTRFFNLFYAEGSPSWILPILSLIELISYIFRVISLCVRLSINIISGHILIEFFFMLLYKYLFFTSYYNIFTFLFIILMLSSICLIILLFEMFVALFQSYIFTLLCLIYLSEIIGPNNRIYGH